MQSLPELDRGIEMLRVDDNENHIISAIYVKKNHTLCNLHVKQRLSLIGITSSFTSMIIRKLRKQSRGYHPFLKET